MSRDILINLVIGKIFKSSKFERYAKKERITDGELCDAVENAEKGLNENGQYQEVQYDGQDQGL